MKTANGNAWTIGTDVEGGLFHRPTHTYIPATAYNTGGEKGAALDLFRDKKLVGTYHRDNIGVEFQSIPADNEDAWVNNLVDIYKALTVLYMDRINARVSYTPTVTYENPAMLEVPEAMEMGCEPDFCAYSEKKEKGPSAVEMNEDSIRAYSGHIHIGYKFKNKAGKLLFVKWLDVLLGTYSALLDAQAQGDAGILRRKYYGQAGRYRNKPYGIEYRTPSNSWYMKTVSARYGKAHGKHVITLVNTALNYLEAGKTPEDFGIDLGLVRRAIDGTEPGLKAQHYSDEWEMLMQSVRYDIGDKLKVDINTPTKAMGEDYY